MKTALLVILLLGSTGLKPASSAPIERIVVGGLDGADPADTSRSFPIGLAISGGGARGLSTIGVLQAFNEAGISIEAIAGTSMGGIVGGLYSAGYSADEIEAIVMRTDFRGLFSSEPSRRQMFLTQRQDRDQHLVAIRFNNLRPVVPQALTQAQRLTALLTSLTTEAAYRAAGDFSRLPIPFKTVCTDVVSGEEVVLDAGSLADAMRATVAFPLALSGLETNGQILMDGGIVNPIPVDIAHTMSDSGLFIVAVNTATPLLSKEDLRTPFDLAGQVTTIMTYNKLVEQIALADYLVKPELGTFTTTDFKYKDSLIGIGYRAGREAAREIRARIERRQDEDLVHISAVESSDTTNGVVADARRRLSDQTLPTWQLGQYLKNLCVRHDLFRLEATLIWEQQDDTAVPSASLELTVWPSLAVDAVQLSFENNTVIDDSSLAALLIGDAEYLTSSRIRAGLDSIVEVYHRLGVDLAFVESANFDYDQQRLTILVNEAVIDNVVVLDNQRTADWYVRSYFPLKPGQAYSNKKATRGLSNLYGTDLFDRVTVDVVRSDGDATVQLRVTEKAYTQVRLGWHWHDDYDSEEFITILDDNLLGAGIEARLHGRYSPDRRHYYAGLRANRLWSTYLTAGLRFYHSRLIRSLYALDGDVFDRRKEKTDGVEFTVGQQLARLGQVSGGVAFEEIETRLHSSRHTDKYNLRLITLESLLENFDRIPFPERGSKYHLQLRLAGKLFGGDIEYTRFYSTGEMYIRLGSDVNYHPRAALGLSRSGLPPTEKFYLGGAHSFSGYNTYQLAGDKFFLISNELRFRLPLRLFLSLRWDIGNVYGQTESIKLANVRNGFGAYLAVDSPIGPIEFGYGVTDDEPSIDETYIHVGLAF